MLVVVVVVGFATWCRGVVAVAAACAGSVGLIDAIGPDDRKQFFPETPQAKDFAADHGRGPTNMAPRCLDSSYFYRTPPPIPEAGSFDVAQLTVTGSTPKGDPSVTRAV